MEQLTARGFASVSQVVICFFAAAILFVVHARGEPKTTRRDPSWLWLGLATALWGVIGLFDFLEWPSRALAPYARVVLSTLNTGCILLAVTYLDYGPPWLKRLEGDLRLRLAVFAVTGAVASGTLLATLLEVRVERAAIPDVALSLVTLSFLGYGLCLSFARRQFVALAWMAGMAVALQGLAQLPEVYAPLQHWLAEWRWVLLLTSKTAVIGLFLVLVAAELYERIVRPIIPVLRIDGTKRGDWWIVGIVIRKTEGLEAIDGVRRRTVVRDSDAQVELECELSPAPYRRLLLFAVQTIRDDDARAGGWIRLDEKGLAASDLRRIASPFGVQYGALFENDRTGRYRLRVDPKDLRVDGARLAQVLRRELERTPRDRDPAAFKELTEILETLEGALQPRRTTAR